MLTAFPVPVTFNVPRFARPVVSIVPLPNWVLAVTLPIVNPVKVPRLVMLPCALPVTVPAYVELFACATVPVTLAPITLLNP